MGIIRAKGGQVDKKVASTEINQLRAQVSSLTEQVEQLRHVSTGFDISFDKRLSDIELQARLAKLSDVEANGIASTVQTGRLG
jgi:TolA-binding protein